MTVSQARLMLASLPDDSELVLSCCSPMYSQVRGFVVREGNKFEDGSLWRSQKGYYPGIETTRGEMTKVVEVEFERSR